MDEILHFLKKNIFGIACSLYSIGYLIFRFSTWKSAVLFLLVLAFLYFSFFFFIDFCRKVIYRGVSIKKALYGNKIIILLLAGISVVVILLAGWVFLSALWFGISTFAVFVALLFYFRKKTAN